MNISKLIRPITILIAAFCLAAASLLGCQSQDAPHAKDVTSMRVPDATSASTTSPSKASQAPVMTDKMQRANAAVDEIVADLGDSVSVIVRPLDGSGGFSINGDKTFASGSVIKLLVLAKLMELVDSGKLSMQDTYTVEPGDIVAGTGVIAGMGAGTTLTMDELARYMIAESDNVATNVLIDRIGMDAVDNKARELGLSQTSIQRKMMDTESGKENYMSANDAAVLLDMIANKTLASEAMCNKAIEYLCAQSDDDALAAGLPDSVRLGNKAGAINASRHDCGIVFTDEPYVIAVFTDDLSSPDALIASVSSAVYEALGK